MEQNAFNLLSAIVAILSLLVTIIGLYAVYIQINKLRQSAWSNTHSTLCNQSLDILKYFSEHSYTYDYFYKNKPLTDTDEHRVIVLYAAEVLANFMEHLILQKENLPARQWGVWHRFICSTFKYSIVAREFILNNADWYSQELVDMTMECDRQYRQEARA